MHTPFLLRPILAGLLLLFLGGAGCFASTAPNPPGQAAAPAENSLPAELSRGRAYFLRECRTCHRLFAPEERTPESWQTILARKAARVSLTREQYEKLRAYVLAASQTAVENR